jgi:4-amino-4-deoxy-L-arabinose transferase-like glycosyltransferase
MLLMAFLSALVGMTVAEIVRRESTGAVGFAAGLIVLLNPRWQISAQSVMSEVLAALLVTWAVIAFSEYLEQENWRFSLLFGVIAALALLTKGTGIELSLVPPLAVILTRRFRLLLRPSFWLPLVPVILMCLPWYLLVPGSRHEKLDAYGGVYWAMRDVAKSPGIWAELAGPMIAIAALVFLAVRLYMSFRDAQTILLWSVVPALLCSTMIFSSFIAAWSSRHLIHAVPLLAAAASVGVFRLVQRLHSRPEAITLLLLALQALLVGIRPHPKTEFGFARVAHDIALDSRSAKSGIVVLSDSIGEGSFVAEIALGDVQRPNRYVLRGTKVITKEDWFGEVVQAGAGADLPALQKQFEEMPVSLVVADLAPAVISKSRDLFLEMMKQNSSRWEKVKEYPRHFPDGQDSTIAVFRLTGSTPGPLERVPDQLGSR